MLAAIRRFRLVALIALFASPGVGGAAVQLLHQCPVSNAPLADGAHHGGDGPAHHGNPATPAGGHEQCHCIGECCATAVAVAPEAHAGITISIVSFTVAPAGTRDVAPAFSPLHLLPPATAPPATALAPLS